MTTKAEILRSIRGKCIDCSGGNAGEVRCCPVTGYDLWPYRLGRDPEPARGRGFGNPACTRAVPTATSTA